MRPRHTTIRSTDPVELRDRIVQLRAMSRSISDRQALEALSAVIADIEERVALIERILAERSRND
jgi:hypothetical protein